MIVLKVKKNSEPHNFFHLLVFMFSTTTTTTTTTTATTTLTTLTTLTTKLEHQCSCKNACIQQNCHNNK